jgi:hypothetical protein
MKRFLVFHVRRGVKIAVWQARAATFELAVHAIKQENEDHRSGDRYELAWLE